ncbi:Isochorismatase [Corynebacterium occultum]|uniref:Isochorismatase n=1 Tax=Corynebacterium occultum TaxID=2675219 RepID=A0A6B8W3B6_9CORY|nr:phosphopantetheine-binding protein [Corynebacterium occultum]QGU08014.1 Isochorismatase [Corynebacterium occultum]
MIEQARIIGDIATITDTNPESLSADTVLADHGLDSLRLMTLVEDWRAAGVEIDYYEMFSLRTLGEWLEHLNVEQG